MAFSFQINDDIKFIENKIFLEKAIKYRPELISEKVVPIRCVKTVPDKEGYLGVSVVEDSLTLDKLMHCPMKKNDSFILDFGRHIVGKFSIDIDCMGSPMDAPLYLKVSFAENPAELECRAEEYEGWLSSSWIQEERIHIDELPYQLKMGRRYAFRYVKIDVLDTSPKWGAVFSNSVAEATSSAPNEPEKQYHCADEELQKIYEVGINTLHECMQEVFEDGPKRDRRLWLGDLRLQALANYASYDLQPIVKSCLYRFAAMTTKDGMISANVFTNPKPLADDTFLFDYSLFFISVLNDYLDLHEDDEVLEDLYPVAKRQMDKALEFVSNGELKLTDKYPVFIDWSDKFDKTTSSEAVFIYALKQFIQITNKIGKDTHSYERILDEMAFYSREKLFDESKGLFVSGDTKEINVSSQIWMILAHVLDKKMEKGLMRRTIDILFPVQGIATPYMYHHIVEAMLECGENEEAIKLIKDYWGAMVRYGADTYWEAFMPEDPGFSPYGNPIVSSFCHAWSCTPVYLLPKYLL